MSCGGSIDASDFFTGEEVMVARCALHADKALAIQCVTMHKWE